MSDQSNQETKNQDTEKDEEAQTKVSGSGQGVYNPSEMSDEERKSAEDAGFVFSEAEKQAQENPPQPAEPAQPGSPDQPVQPQPDPNNPDQGEGGEQVV